MKWMNSTPPNPKRASMMPRRTHGHGYPNFTPCASGSSLE
ncbi:hypothetical protein GuangZ0019_1101 [Mycobacterium tuberculosis GuangZ0019]|nr:hypothetical protein Mb1595_p3673 [Mycobacterium tuberculosis variant bovis]AOZ44646.1 hypothetical protein BTB1458_3650 [Mycobacterium tuberculosis]EQM20924.1 hypothetical protein FJ05194_1981 [Mycobacterium tuberculosis FJ05194]EQM22554.1 hypothetical protein GuangZ0019_1101 [Mycobacterium tuberculosis GuangZ0019]KAF3414096.1 hypothetical protein BIS44_2400 [Mycobacterium tuberculosis variant bovis BCG]BAQ07483.1 hypothetical protein KURONO_3705 [Mycobacterium tuberculosis str. Kurono]